MSLPRRWILAGVVLLAAGCHSPGAAVPRPNIIFIMADDLGYGDLGCYGQRHIQTPNLDRMASEGIRFTQCYAGATVCAPSRCVLMQGLHTGHCRVRGNAGRLEPLAQSLRAEDRTVADILKEAGYRTGLIGKWGLGDANGAEPGLPRRQGFDYFFGYLNQHHAHNYYPTFLWRNEEKVRLSNTVPNEDWAGGGKSNNRVQYSDDLIAEEALEFVRRHRGERFFLYYAPTLPHANNEARREGMEVPDLGIYRDRAWPEPIKGYAAMVSRLDEDVGRLLDLLRELHLETNTVVFFTSDNGPHKEGGYDPGVLDSNGPLRGIKRDLYEGGVRVPMIVRWQGRIEAGAVSNALWWFPDFLPTAAELAGADAPEDIDGVSVAGLLLRGRTRGHPPLYWEFHEGSFKQAVRRGRWKAVRQAPDQAVELYDLREDLGETRDLASERPRLTRRLGQRMSRMRADSPDWPVKKQNTSR
jgi:uncharacterized sulfatase